MFCSHDVPDCKQPVPSSNTVRTKLLDAPRRGDIPIKIAYKRLIKERKKKLEQAG